MGARLLVVVGLAVLGLGACASADEDAEPAITQGYYTANDSSFAFPLVILRTRGRVLYSYAVYQYGCEGGATEVSFRAGGSVRPVPSDIVPLVSVSTESEDCGIEGFAHVSNESDLEVEVRDVSGEEIERRPLERIERDAFVEQFNEFGFLVPETGAQPEQDDFCNALFQDSCAISLLKPAAQPSPQ